VANTTIITAEESYDFGAVERGRVSDDIIIDVTNELDIAITLTRLTLSGIHAAHFAAVEDPRAEKKLPLILETGDSYGIYSTFTPTATVLPGEKSAKIHLYAGSDIVLEADLTGTATASGIVPQIYDIITEEDVFPSGVLVDEHGAYQDSYDTYGNKIVDSTYGIVPAGSSTAHDPPRLRAKGNIDLREFRRLVYKVLSIVSPDLLFMPAYPKHIVGNRDIEGFTDPVYSADNPIDEFQDTVTWKVVRREPGVFTGSPFGESTNRKEIKPRIRERATFHPSKDNQYLDIYGQWFDNLVQFDLWTKTNEEAEVLIEWFEDFMDMYRNIFMEYGLENLIYWRRFEDQTLLKWANPLHVRSVQYFCRTEKLTAVPTYKIKQIHLKLMETVDTVGESNQYSSGEMQRSLFS